MFRKRIRFARLFGVLAVIGVVLVAATFVPFPATPFVPDLYEIVYTKTSGVCAGKSIVVERRASMQDEINIRLGTGNNKSWTEARVFLNVATARQDRCNAWADYVGLRHLRAALYVRDETQPFVAQDQWINGILVLTSIAGDVAGGGKASPNVVEANGGKLLAWVDLEWTPSKVNAINITFPIAVTDVRAEPHHLDRLLFTAVLTLTVSETACAGACWSPFFDERMSQDLTIETVVRGEPTR